jgi:hypothetical protein
MKKMTSVRFAVALVATSLALSVAATGCVGGNEGLAAPDVGSESPAAVVPITAGSVERLQPGERLVVDLRDKTKIFQIDVSEGSIDFSRIDVLSTDAPRMPMDQWLIRQQQAEPKLDIDSMMKHGFAISESSEDAEAYAASKQAGGTAGPGYSPQGIVCVTVGIRVGWVVFFVQVCAAG